MGLAELILIAIGLSMDAFAVSVCKGLNMTKVKYKNCFLIALSFGAFQGLMPLIGWFLGTRFEQYIVSFDHWVAFGLLSLIGGKMIYDSFGANDSCGDCSDNLDIKELLVLSVATSIDALAVGITFALLPGTNIVLSVVLIGVITFGLCLVGVFVGNRFGSKYEKKAQLAGGVILIAIGLKILADHLM